MEERCTALIKRVCVNDHEDRQPMKDYFQHCDSSFWRHDNSGQHGN